MANNTNQLSYDVERSGGAQANFLRVAGHLEELIGRRDAQVAAAMADYQAQGVSDEYAAKEQRWHTVADHVRTVITTLRSTLARNDETAQAALRQAGAAVAAIG